MFYSIFPPDGILEADITLPPSKSILARRLVIASVAGELSAHQPSFPQEDTADDITVLSDALTSASPRRYLAKSATALRFLTAYFAATPGTDIILDGDESLRRRPLGPLTDALRILGVDISFPLREGFAPVAVKGRQLSGADITLEPGISSQWLSALMMVAPLLSGPLNINLTSETPSYPYILLTAAQMTLAGLTPEVSRYSISVTPGSYTIPDGWLTDIEPDWSAATFWYEITALTAGWTTLRGGLCPDSPQADRFALNLFERLGVTSDFTPEGLELAASPEMHSRIDFDASDCPDIVPACVVTCCALGVPFKITGLDALPFKESDRIASLTGEALKIGCPLTTPRPGVLEWEGRRMPVFEMPVIDPHGDHRIAMAFAPLAVFLPGLTIADPGCVAKSWPGFWNSLRRAGFTITENNPGSSASEQSPSDQPPR